MNKFLHLYTAGPIRIRVECRNTVIVGIGESSGKIGQRGGNRKKPDNHQSQPIPPEDLFLSLKSNFPSHHGLADFPDGKKEWARQKHSCECNDTEKTTLKIKVFGSIDA